MIEEKSKCKACSTDRSKTASNRMNFCCMFRALSTQPDFINQKEWLQETVEERGHLIIFFPKFHCELNFIEMVWGFLKRDLRDNCEFDFDALLQRVRDMLENLLPTKISMIRKFHNRCLRFMGGYRNGLHGPMLEYAVKKYTSHRMFPSDFIIAQFEEEYREHCRKK